MKPDYVFMGLKGSSQFKMMNLHTQAIKLFGDAKVNEYRFPYRARQVQATSQDANRPRPPPTTSSGPTETPVARTASRLDSNRVGRLS